MDKDQAIEDIKYFLNTTEPEEISRVLDGGQFPSMVDAVEGNNLLYYMAIKNA